MFSSGDKLGAVKEMVKSGGATFPFQNKVSPIIRLR